MRILVHISDGDNVTAVSTKKKAIDWVKLRYPEATKQKILELVRENWQEISVD